MNKMNKKREQDAGRKSSREFKRTRRNSRKKKNQKTNSMEAREGVTYESGIGLRQSAEEKTALTNGTISDLMASLTEKNLMAMQS